MLGIAELEQVRDALAIRLREAQVELSARVDVEEQSRELVERMIAEPQRFRWVAGVERAPRRTRLQALALAPTLGHPRDAARLVAGEALLWLSVSHRTRRRRVPPASLLASVGAFRVASNQKEARSARRGAAPVRAEPAPEATEASKPARPSRRRPEAEDAPLPPWGRFPLVELAVLAGIIFLVVGFFFASGDAQAILIAVGLVLASIAGLEVAVREHCRDIARTP